MYVQNTKIQNNINIAVYIIYPTMRIAFFLILPLSGVALEPKLCINCKHFQQNRISGDVFGKCSLFLKENDNKDYLVTGIPDTSTDYHYCSVARSSEKMCGESAKHYEENTAPRIAISANKISTQIAVITFVYVVFWIIKYSVLYRDL